LKRRRLESGDKGWPISLRWYPFDAALWKVGCPGLRGPIPRYRTGVCGGTFIGAGVRIPGLNGALGVVGVAIIRPPHLLHLLDPLDEFDVDESPFAELRPYLRGLYR
jgi:hypothetical protein